MRNRGKRGGRRVGCIVCGRLTVQSLLVLTVVCDVRYICMSYEHVSTHSSLLVIVQTKDSVAPHVDLIMFPY